MIVKNPTDSILSVQIKGVVYEIAPNSEIRGVSPEAATHWQEHVHNFIKVEAETPVVAAPAKKIEVEVKETPITVLTPATAPTVVTTEVVAPVVAKVSSKK